MYGYIYETTNLVNNKKYIGKKKSNNFLGNNYLGSGIALGNAIIKYGKANFVVKLLKECDSLDSLNQQEKYWIKFYRQNTAFELYNIADGGDGGNVTPLGGHYGHKMSDETKQKISNALKGRKLTEQTKQKIACKNRGRKHTTQTKTKISNSCKGNHLGHKCSPETKRKISETLKAKRIKHTVETKRKISEKAKGRTVSEETKRKISETLKRKYASN